MLVGSLVVIGAVAAPAQAACFETGYHSNVSIYIGGVRRGVESTRSPETCNRNGVYYGKIADTYTDGSCLSIQFFDPETVYVGTQGTSCDSAGYNFTFWDQTGDVEAYFRGRLTAFGTVSSKQGFGAY